MCKRSTRNWFGDSLSLSLCARTRFSFFFFLCLDLFFLACTTSGKRRMHYMDVVEEEVCIEGKERDVVWRGPAAASSRVSSSPPLLQRILRLSSTFPSACLTFARRSCFAVAGMQANIAGYSSKLAKDAIPTSQFSHSAELQKIPSHRYCSQQTNSVPRAQLSLSLSRGTCSTASDTTIHPTKSLVHSHSPDSRFYRLFTRTPSIGLSGFPGDDKILPAL